LEEEIILKKVIEDLEKEIDVLIDYKKE